MDAEVSTTKNAEEKRRGEAEVQEHENRCRKEEEEERGESRVSRGRRGCKKDTKGGQEVEEVEEVEGANQPAPSTTEAANPPTASPAGGRPAAAATKDGLSSSQDANATAKAEARSN